MFLEKEDIGLELLIEYNTVDWPYIREYLNQNNYQYKIGQASTGHHFYNKC